MKILFFSLHSGIWIHAFPEALVAETLQKAGHEIAYATCGRVLKNHCVAMSAVGIGPDATESKKESVCRYCESSKRLIRREFNFPGHDLADDITAEERLVARRETQDLQRESFLEYSKDGVDIGRIALYEFLLMNKKSSLEFDDKEWSEYLIYFENALLTFFGARRILARENPQRVIAYNALYSVNRIMCELAESKGVATYFLHAGLNLSNRLQTLLFGRRNPFVYYRHMLEAWPRFRHLPCSPEDMKSITDHFMVLFRGDSPFGYSAASDSQALSIRDRFGAKPGQKILVATMSSYDERFAAETVGALPAAASPVFPKQVDWIKALIDYVAQRDDLLLIVRVHPREFPNRRERGKSEHARSLEEILKNELPGNVRINWPTDGISLYDMVYETSVFLNAWSAVGKEMSLLGAPVVLYAPSMVAYPPELNYASSTREGYFAEVEKALADGWSIEHSRRTYRWLAVEYGYGLINIADAFPAIELGKGSLFKRIARKLRREIGWLAAERRDCRRRPGRITAAQEVVDIIEQNLETPCGLDGKTTGKRYISAEEETEALCRELGRISKVLLKPGIQPADPALIPGLASSPDRTEGKRVQST